MQCFFVVCCLCPFSGETEYNRLGIIQGQSDIPLSDVGRHQADLVASRLAREEEEQGVRFDMIFSSDLSRAAQVNQAMLLATLLTKLCFM